MEAQALADALDRKETIVVTQGDVQITFHSAISLFVTFLAVLQRLGLPLPQGKEWGLLIARLVAGYLLFFFVLAIVVEAIFDNASVIVPLLAPELAIALWLGWVLVKPFFFKG